MTAIFTALLSAAAAFIGSWLAAYFALNRFYHERIWERRAAAYTAVFEAIYDQTKWHSTHIDATMEGRKIPNDEAAKLSADAIAALRAMARRVDAETWLVSDKFRERVQDLVHSLSKERDDTNDWREFLEGRRNALQSAGRDLRDIARRELRVPPDRIVWRPWD
jgi:hypothetical protein